MKTAIVTGATGFIGPALVELLCSKGIRVFAIGRKNLDLVGADRSLKIKKASYLKLDMNYIENLASELEKKGWTADSDCVFFNLAWGGENGLSDQNITSQLKNVSTSYQAFDVAIQIGCKKFIQIGTMEELFALKYLNLDYKNEMKTNRHIIYALAKIMARKSLKLKSMESNIEYIYINHSHIMGIGDDKDSFLQSTLINLIEGKPLNFSSGEQIFDVVSLEDCINAYFLIGKSGRSGIDYWVGSGKPRRLREYVEVMYELYPSQEKMNFGSIGYEDVKVDPEDFSTALLQEHTGYKPKFTYEEIVKILHDSFTSPNS